MASIRIDCIVCHVLRQGSVILFLCNLYDGIAAFSEGTCMFTVKLNDKMDSVPWIVIRADERILKDQGIGVCPIRNERSYILVWRSY